MRIWIEQVAKGETAWAVLVDGEPVVTGLTKREAERRRHWLEFMAHPTSAPQPGSASPAADTQPNASLREGLAYGLAPLDVNARNAANPDVP